MTDDLVQRLRRTYRKEYAATGSMVGDISNRLRPFPILASEVLFNPDGSAAADRIEQLEREKAVVSDLWEQQKEIALDYLADCNKAADRIEAQAAEIERLRVETKAQFDRGYYDGCTRSVMQSEDCPKCDKFGDDCGEHSPSWEELAAYWKAEAERLRTALKEQSK